jgi:hypothetical protein
LFQLFETGGKFAAGFVDTSTPVANLPPVSTTLAKLVEKVAVGVVDTGGNPAASIIDSSCNFAAGLVDTSGAS